MTLTQSNATLKVPMGEGRTLSDLLIEREDRGTFAAKQSTPVLWLAKSHRDGPSSGRVEINCFLVVASMDQVQWGVHRK